MRTVAARGAASSSGTPGTARRSSFRGMDMPEEARALSRNSVIATPSGTTSMHAPARDVHVDAATSRVASKQVAKIAACVARRACGMRKALKTSDFRRNV